MIKKVRQGWLRRGAALFALGLLIFGCGNATGSPPASSSASAASPLSSPTPTAPEPIYTASALPAIVLTRTQIGYWQTATRLDLTGPFTVGTNTNAKEAPKPPANLQAGYRQTIGNPGAGLNTVRTILEIFDTPATAEAAMTDTVQGYEAIGYSKNIDPSAVGLPTGAASREGFNVQIAPDFALGMANQGIVFVWRRGNLLLIQLDGGDSGWTPDAAKKWVVDVDANATAATGVTVG